jgi:U4/U6.U5 tri-snRNP component SNU23
VVDLGRRLEVRKEVDERERDEKRAKRREKRRKTEGGVGIKEEDEEGFGGGIIC